MDEFSPAAKELAVQFVLPSDVNDTLWCLLLVFFIYVCVDNISEGKNEFSIFHLSRLFYILREYSFSDDRARLFSSRGLTEYFSAFIFASFGWSVHSCGSAIFDNDI